MLANCYTRSGIAIIINDYTIPCIVMRLQTNVVMERKDLVLIKQIAKNRGQSYSDFVRIALRKELARLGYLSQNEAKALEVMAK